MYKECIVILWNELEMRLGYEEALARDLGYSHCLQGSMQREAAAGAPVHNSLIHKYL